MLSLSSHEHWHRNVLNVPESSHLILASHKGCLGRIQYEVLGTLVASLSASAIAVFPRGHLFTMNYAFTRLTTSGLFNTLLLPGSKCNCSEKWTLKCFAAYIYSQISQCHNVQKWKDGGGRSKRRAVARDKHKHTVVCRTHQSRAAGRRIECRQLNTVTVNTALSGWQLKIMTSNQCPRLVILGM